jgi:hypothetical protein
LKTQRTTNVLRIFAGVLLIIAVFLPLYTVPTSMGGDAQATHSWDLAREDAGVALLVIAFLGPAAVIILSGHRRSGGWSILLLAAELTLLGMSIAVLSKMAESAITLLPILGPWLSVPVTGSMGTGAWLALAADGILFVLWLAQVGSQLRAPSPLPR